MTRTLLSTNETLFKLIISLINCLQNCLQIFWTFEIHFYLRNRLPKLYLAKLLGIVIFNSLLLRTLFGPLNFFDSSVTDESFVDKTRVWRKYKIFILVSSHQSYRETTDNICSIVVTTILSSFPRRWPTALDQITGFVISQWQDWWLTLSRVSLLFPEHRDLHRIRWIYPSQ